MAERGSFDGETDRVFLDRKRVRRPVALPPVGAMRLRHRLLLTGEILLAYVPLARLVSTDDVEAMVSEARRRDRPGGLSAAEARATALRLGYIVERLLAVFPTDDRCLIRSLVVLRMLGERGIPANLVIGVRTESGFGAHAWVEYDGRPVLSAGEFSPLTVL
jgi:Transglutaminase-like superfamily